MKIIMILLLFSTSLNPKEVFYNTIVEDYEFNSYLVVVLLSDGCSKINVAIPNSTLYYFLSKYYDYDKNSYEEYVKNKMTRNEAIKVKSLSELSFHTIDIFYNNKVDSISSLGKAIFINHYFDKTTLKNDFDDSNLGAIIEQLFLWDVPVRKDDETGYYIISNEASQKLRQDVK